MLHGVTDGHEQFQPLARIKSLLVAELRNRDSTHQFHHKIGPSRIGRSGVIHAGDVRMVHQRQRLPLRFESGDHVARVHARFDDLQRNFAPHRLLLFGNEYQPEAPLTNLLHQLVCTDHYPWAFDNRCEVGGVVGTSQRISDDFVVDRDGIKQIVRPIMGLEQLVDLGPQPRIARADVCQEGVALVRRLFKSGEENRLLAEFRHVLESS